MPETINIECTGYSVVADWYQGNSTNEIVLCLIGYTSNRKKYLDRLPNLTKETGMSAIVFDYSGHGDSPFDLATTRPAQHFLEVIYLYDWLKTKYSNSKINVIGSSYGGFLAAQLTSYRPVNKLILRAPSIYRSSDFYTMQKDIDRDYLAKVYRKDSEALANHSLLKHTSTTFDGKCLVIVHEHDELVPTETTDAYIQAFNAEQYFAAGFPHSLDQAPVEDQAEYHQKINEWLKR
jgi:uncharacterized protein